jgi:general secretion pathway protein I
MTRARDAGFTLIETLVALAVLAMSAVALLGATEAHIARISDLETRAAALWAAENMLAELTLGVAPETAPEPMLGIGFALAVTSSPTQDPDLTRVDITASAAGGPVLARLTGFLDASAAGSAASR